MSKQQLPVLTTLPTNKTVVFYSPIQDDNILVRTGTLSEGSCFLHAFLHAYSKDYVSMNETGRIKFVKKLCESIKHKIYKTRWENLSTGLMSEITFQENITTLLSDFYSSIINQTTGRTKSIRGIIQKVKKEDNDVEVYKLITEMIPLEHFEKNILPSAYEKCNKKIISKCKKIIVRYTIEHYSNEFKKLKVRLNHNKIIFYIKKLEKLIQEIVDEAENIAYSEYIKNLHTSIEVDSHMIELVSEKFNRDIYFIDSRTRMPYIDTKNIKQRKSIIIMWMGGYNYEIVGKLLSGNNVQREFNYNDSLIKRIYTFLCKPMKIPDEYPNLIPYLQKDSRKKLGFGISDSETYRSDNDKYINSDDDIEPSEESKSDKFENSNL